MVRRCASPTGKRDDEVPRSSTSVTPVGRAAAVLDEQLDGTLGSHCRELRIRTARSASQPQKLVAALARATGNRHRIDVSGLEENVARALADPE